MEDRSLTKIQMNPVGFVQRLSPDEDVRDRSLVATIVCDERLAPALDGIDEWSHLYVICWLHLSTPLSGAVLHHPSSGAGVFGTRSPIHPKQLGLTLVELVQRKDNVLWVKGLDAADGTPVLDIKPYLDWDRGSVQVVTEFKAPRWLVAAMEHRQKDAAGKESEDVQQ